MRIGSTAIGPSASEKYLRLGPNHSKNSPKVPENSQFLQEPLIFYAKLPATQKSHKYP
jgi:hypothetical protein